LTEPALSDDEIHRVTGEPDRVGAPPISEALTLVSWNIAYGRKCERHADVLASFDPDVCCRKWTSVAGERVSNAAQWLGERLRMNWLFRRTRKSDRVA
jgi:hypothetical protein